MAVNPKKDALTSSDLAGAIPEDFVGAVNKNAKFAPGDVAYCRAFACNARVMSVGTTKSGICNYKVALYDAKGVPTGEAVCSESDLVRRSVRGLKLTGLASGASRACDVAATILEKMVQRNKVDLPLAKKVLRLTQRDFPDARVSVAAAKLNENPPALLSAAKILRAEANRLRAQGKSMKAMRAAVKRAPAEALPMIAPLHSKLLMVYRKFIGSPETASLGSLPALAAQWKAVGNKLPDEEQSGVALIVRDLISAYRSFTKEQTKNVAYFLAMALGTANKMVGGSANVPIPAHLRSVKADQTQVRAFHAALDELRELSMKINQLRANPVGGIKKDLLKGLWTKPDRANNILVGAGIDIPGYQQQTRQTIALIDKIAQRGTGSPEGVYGDLLFDNLYSVAIEKQFVNMLNRIFDSTGKLTVLLSQYRQSQREWPVASVKAIDAKEYYEKNKKIPVGSILRVNGKLVQVERANGYVISGYEYKKPQSTNTHVSVDLRNTPATLLSVGNGTFRFARDGNVVFGRRPAN